MKKFLIVAFSCLAAQAGAQNSLLTASPIPDDAETRFCYYAGLAYSVNAYIMIGGGGQVMQATGNTSDAGTALHSGGQVRRSEDQKPLRCVAGEDGVLGWSAVATLQIGQ